jgi:hypothetical protein
VSRSIGRSKNPSLISILRDSIKQLAGDINWLRLGGLVAVVLFLTVFWLCAYDAAVLYFD